MLVHGSVFLELYVSDPAYYIRLFRDALGFRVERDEEDFVELRSAAGVVLLNAFAELPAGHPFEGFRENKRRGIGIEIGLVTDELEKTWNAAKTIEGCKVSDIVTQEWGMSDFRILTPDGYYLRLTTPPTDDELAAHQKKSSQEGGKAGRSFGVSNDPSRAVTKQKNLPAFPPSCCIPKSAPRC